MKPRLVFGIAGGMAMLFSGAALAQPAISQQNAMPQQNATSQQDAAAKKEAGTAHIHATLSQKATSLKMAHTHLQHVVNCLVGPDGKDFDSAAANPCASMGNGAVPDSEENQAMHMRMNRALDAARMGLKTTDLKASHAAAAKVAKLLQPTSGNTNPVYGSH